MSDIEKLAGDKTQEEIIHALVVSAVEQDTFNRGALELFKDAKCVLDEYKKAIEQLQQRVKLLEAQQEDLLVNPPIKKGYH